jgi:hypothetical protein
MNTKLEIVGAGLAGLLAGNMLARHRPTIFERQSCLPNNHSAVLRFRTPTIGDVVGIPFRAVTMIKTTAAWQNPVADALAYSYKNTGRYLSDRSARGVQIEERFVAPDNFIHLLAEQIPTEIKFNHDYVFPQEDDERIPIISTIPMPALMEALDYPSHLRPEFHSTPGRNIHARVHNCDAYVSLMVPHPSTSISRISLTGDELIIECTADNIPSAGYLTKQACEYLGFDPNDVHSITEHRQRYQKLVAIPEPTRKNFMFWATDKYNIFSLGRFATWRPNLLLDDLVNDIRKIETWAHSRYELARVR